MKIKPSVGGTSAPLQSLIRTLVLLAVFNSWGCAVTKITTAKNQALSRDQGEMSSVPRAQESSPRTFGSQVYVGIAISGGGSRAANFSWNVLEKLDKLGLLAHANAISSVSGGSLAAALYALNSSKMTSDEAWARHGTRLGQNYISPLVKAMLNPFTWFKLATSDFERTHVMVEIFDRSLFYGAKYGDLGAYGPGKPRLFLNATSATQKNEGTQFVFTEESFRNALGSRLDTYPIADAVMASGAFPGVFGNITLKVFDDFFWSPKTQQMEPAETYERVFDGGVAENLGLKTLLADARATYRQSVKNNEPLKGCFIFLIDAYTPNFSAQRKVFTKDTDHALVDLIVKRTAWDAIGGLLNNNRATTLQTFGQISDQEPFRLDTKWVPFVKRGVFVGEQTPTSFFTWEPLYNPISRFPLFDPARTSGDWWWRELEQFREETNTK